jgi:hypothetical protein
MRAVIAVALSALLIGGCGGGGGGGQRGGGDRARSDRLVDFSLKPPYVNALDIDPGTGDFLLTTNRGFFRMDAKRGAGATIAATETRLVRSTDGARRWRPVGEGSGIRLAWPAQDALSRAVADGTVERSRDGGETWRRVVSTKHGRKTWTTAFRP